MKPVDCTNYKTPPFRGARGKWVNRKDFAGRKSFGVFHCFVCRNKWVSAHAQVRYGQQCTRCKSLRLKPRIMWVNHEQREQSESPPAVKKKPHRKDLCGACKAGVCRIK